MEPVQLPKATKANYTELIDKVCNDRIQDIERLLGSWQFDQEQLSHVLALAMSNGRHAAFTLLLERQANPNAVTSRELPLCQAVDLYPKYVRPLIVFGAHSSQVCNLKKMSPLEMARAKLEEIRTSQIEPLFNNESAASLESRENVRQRQIETYEQLVRHLELPSSLACGNIATAVLSRETGVKRKAHDLHAKYVHAAKRPVTLESALRHQDMQQFDTLLEKFRPEALTDRDRAEVDRAVRHCFTMGYTSQLDKLKERGADIEQSFKYFATSLHTPNHAKVAEHCLNNKWIILATIKKMYNEIKDAKKSSHYYELSDEEWAQRKQTIENILEKALKEAGAL